MLRRNRFGFRMRRRSMTNRLLQFVVVLSVSTMFICLLLYAVNFPADERGPDYSWLKTRNMTAFIRPGDFSTTLIEPKNPFCRIEEKLRLLVTVLSSPENAERRRIIRKTWGDKIKKLPGVKVLYVFGKSNDNAEIKNAIREEHMVHNDVLQHDFVDSFANLTLKTTFLLKWILNNNCSTTKFVFKVDDDSFVNPKRLWSALDHALLHTTTRKSLQPFVRGKKGNSEKDVLEPNTPFAIQPDGPGGLPVQILNAHVKPTDSQIRPRNLEKGEVSRDFNLHDHPILPVNIPDGKSDNQMGKLVPIDIVRNFGKDSRRSFDVEEDTGYGLSESVDYLIMGYVKHSVPIRDPTHKLYLPHRFYPLNIFPRFVGGAGYVITSSVLPALYECLLRTPYMNLEDVMMMGLCATTQIGLRLTHNPLFRNKRPEIGPNYVCYYKESPMMHPVSPIEMEEMWVRILEDGHNCDTFYFAFVQRLSLVVEFLKNLFRL